MSSSNRPHRSKATLYNKNKPLLDVMIQGTKVIDVFNIYDRKLLPIILQEKTKVKEINEWIKKRLIPDEREGFKAVKKEFSNLNDLNKHMFSLSDQYWFLYTKEDNWEDLNFFTNDYSDIVGKMFFCPWEVGDGEVIPPSPDLTTNGVLRKQWQKIGEDNYLIKSGNSKDYKQEPINEILGSITLKKLNIIEFVEYRLTVHGMKFCSKCKNFITKDTEFVPAFHFFKKEEKKKEDDTYTHLLKMIKKYTKVQNPKDGLDSIIAADCYIGNDDRHLGNFGFIRNANNGETLNFAPLFDLSSAYLQGDVMCGESKIFSTKNKLNALKSFAEKKGLKDIPNHARLFEVIDMYPEIKKQEKLKMKNKIIECEKKLNEEMRKYFT